MILINCTDSNYNKNNKINQEQNNFGNLLLNEQCYLSFNNNNFNY